MKLPAKKAAALVFLGVISTACQVGWAVELSIIIEPPDMGYVEINGSRAKPVEKMPKGSEVSLVAQPLDEGWRFDRWEEGLTSKDTQETLMMDESKIVRAVFKRIQPPFIGIGTASIDGVLAPGEWDDAISAGFLVSLPEGGQATATMYAMNDWSNLYLAVKTSLINVDDGTQLTFSFDNDNGGERHENGDNEIGINETLGFFDRVRKTSPACPTGNGQNECSFEDTELGGATDGAGAILDGPKFTVFELFHPLNTLDSENDFSLVPGNSVGFRLMMTLGEKETIFGPTGLKHFGEIQIAFPENQ